MEELEGNVSKFGRSLGSRGHKPSVDPCHFYLEDMPKSIVLSSLSHCSISYSKAFDKLKRALRTIVVFTFCYMHFSKMYAQEYDKLLKALYASALKV